MNSPFIIRQDFLSPILCEKIVNQIKVEQPNLDETDKPIKLETFHRSLDIEISERFQDLIPDIEARFNCTYNGLHNPVFQHFPERPEIPAQNVGCENAKFIGNRWVVYKEDVDLVGYIWLKDYSENVPFDTSYEAYGGKLEFPGHKFSLVPQRGTLVLYPAGPHFVSVISPLCIGDMYQIKLTVSISDPSGAKWFYQPKNHPGTWQDWLNEYM